MALSLLWGIVYPVYPGLENGSSGEMGLPPLKNPDAHYIINKYSTV
jgi:hypothetical protein